MTWCPDFPLLLRLFLEHFLAAVEAMADRDHKEVTRACRESSRAQHMPEIFVAGAELFGSHSNAYPWSHCSQCNPENFRRGGEGKSADAVIGWGRGVRQGGWVGRRGPTPAALDAPPPLGSASAHLRVCVLTTIDDALASTPHHHQSSWGNFRIQTVENRLRNLVSKEKRRFKDEKYDLDLTYINDKIIAMGFPSSGSEAAYRNDADDVYQFFEERHPVGRPFACVPSLRTLAGPLPPFFFV